MKGQICFHKLPAHFNNIKISRNLDLSDLFSLPSVGQEMAIHILFTYITCTLYFRGGGLLILHYLKKSFVDQHACVKHGTPGLI